MLNLVKQKASNQKALSFKDIEKFYLNENQKSLIGLEYERLSLDKNTLKNATYNQMEKIISHFSKEMDWELIFDKNIVIGAHNRCGTSISLEPGCQLELSIAPKENILQIEIESKKIIDKIDKIADSYGVVFLGYGISPKSVPYEIELLQKQRYQIMNEYLPNCPYGELIPKMMRQSAGIQINIDYLNLKDAYLKLKFFNLITPFMTALCANSPFEYGNYYKKKTIRSHVWRYCGKNRCNFFYSNIFDGIFSQKNIVKKYISAILDVPMIFIERDENIISIKGKITFREYLKNGYEGYFATLDDYILHQSLCFPDVRLKKHIEIRNHDSSSLPFALALCAFYKGLSKCDFSKLLSEFSFLKISQIDYYSDLVITNGLDFSLQNEIDGWTVIIKLFNCAVEKLNTKDREYLTPILNMIKAKKTQADILIDYDLKNPADLFDFLY